MEMLEFEKWEGCGNDFILVAEADAHLLTGVWDPVRLCDRHFGVGADGVLIVGRNPASMQVINSDGSRPEMCGNGLRCVAAYLAGASGESDAALDVMTDAGSKRTEVVRDGDGWRVRVGLGRVSFTPADAGVEIAEAGPVALESGAVLGWVASIGNPHWVFLADENPALLKEPIGVFGPPREHDGRFLRRTNVEQVTRVGDLTWRVDVWERGAGVTLACGSGAVCVAGVLVARGHVPPGTPVELELPGGPLRVTIEPDGESLLEGPARRVFTGSLHR